MRLNPLHTPEMITNHMLRTGEYFPPERCTGRSTAQALNIIAEAIRTPHKWVKCLDHHGTEPANRMLADMVRSMVLTLNFNHFHFRGADVCFGVQPNIAKWSAPMAPFQPMPKAPC